MFGPVVPVWSDRPIHHAGLGGTIPRAPARHAKRGSPQHGHYHSLATPCNPMRAYNKHDLEADVRRCLVGGPGPKVVMMTLVSYAGLDEDGRWSCFPSQERIAYESELSVRQVRRILADLEAQQYIGREPRQRPDGRGRNSDRIILQWDVIRAYGMDPTGPIDTIHDQPDIMSARSDQPDIDDRPPGHSAHGSRAVVLSAFKASEQSEEQPPTSPPVPVGPSFDDFWAVYPRKDDKARARRAWPNAIKAADPEVIIAGAIRYRDDPHRYPGFTKQPATWLNAESWDNAPLPSQRASTARSNLDMLNNFARSETT